MLKKTIVQYAREAQALVDAGQIIKIEGAAYLEDADQVGIAGFCLTGYIMREETGGIPFGEIEFSEIKRVRDDVNKAMASEYNIADPLGWLWIQSKNDSLFRTTEGGNKEVPCTFGEFADYLEWWGRYYGRVPTPIYDDSAETSAPHGLRRRGSAKAETIA